MGQGQQFFPLRGALDQQTPPIGIPPGRVIAALNHEAQPNGYQRIEGYERYDGRIAPSDEQFYTLTFNVGVSAFVAGETITGFTSGATARVIDVAQLSSGTFGGGNAAGRLAVHRITGVFQAGELLKVGGVTRATLVSIPVLGDYHAGALELSWLVAAQTYARGLIQPLDTVGGIRGVLVYNNGVCAFSDSGGAGAVYRASTGGWSVKPQKSALKFNLGAFKPPVGVANTITGLTSGATAKVQYVAVDSGDYGASTAAGIYLVDTIVGIFQVGEQMRHNVGEIVGNVVALPVAVTLPAGGRYEFVIFNFYATGSPIVYGVNHVGQAFEFDGSLIAPISTGSSPDVAYKIAEHKNQLFLGLAGGSMINSVVGQPRNYSGQLGAAEIGVGSDITNLIPNTADVMLITTTRRIYTLTGHDSSDFVLSPQGGTNYDSESGPREFSAQNIGQTIYLDAEGVRSITPGMFYGNFRIGPFVTLMIAKTLTAKKKAGVIPVASCVVKSKSQYLLFFSDQSCLSIFFGLKQPEAMFSQYPFRVACIAVGEINGVERVFVGATNGYVYELNKGTSFDGAAIDAYIQLPYSHGGDPRLTKRYQHIAADFQGDPGTQLGVVTRYDYGGSEQPFSEVDNDTLASALGLAGGLAAGNVVWSASQPGRLEFPIDGMGCNMSATFFSSSATIPSYTLSGITVSFKPKGHKR